jgi:DNA-binding transcriptional ArsR family regulator
MYDRAMLLELKAKLYRGFADPTRLSIVESLREGERTVGAIVEAVGQSQPNVSNHLSCLKECGLVTTRREGKSIYYSIASERVRCLLEDGDEVVAEVGDRMSKCTRYNRSVIKKEELE